MFFQLILPGKEGESVAIPYPSGFKFTGERQNVGAIFSDILKYLYPLAGLILFFVLIASGFQLLFASGNEETIKKATKKITSAIIGFVILFISFWLIKLLEFILGVKLLQTG